MQNNALMINPAAASSLMSWWQDAGVEALVDEVPRDWLAVKATPINVMPTAAPTQVSLPDTLDEFINWFMTSLNVPTAGPISQRIAPAGNSQADLMVLIDMPEPEDAVAGHLLAGEAGALFDKMLGALKLDRNAIWFAPMCPTRSAGSTSTEAEAMRLAEIARHHVALVRPKKLWLLGRAASRAILGMDEGAAHGRLHYINHDGSKTDVIASVHPRVLLKMPKRKAEVWADMQKLFES